LHAGEGVADDAGLDFGVDVGEAVAVPGGVVDADGAGGADFDAVAALGAGVEGLLLGERAGGRRAGSCTGGGVGRQAGRVAGLGAGAAFSSKRPNSLARRSKGAIFRSMGLASGLSISKKPSRKKERRLRGFSGSSGMGRKKLLVDSC